MSGQLRKRRQHHNINNHGSHHRRHGHSVVEEEGVRHTSLRRPDRSPSDDFADEGAYDALESPETPVSILDSEDHAKGLDSYNASSPDPIIVAGGLLGNDTIGNNTIAGGGENAASASDMFWTCATPFILMALYALCSRRNIVDSRYHRGALFRRQAERVWEIEREKQRRLDTPLEDRKEQIEKALRRMKVVSKCPSTGRCVLGPIAERGGKAEEEAKEEASEVAAAISMEEGKSGVASEAPKCPNSPGSNEKPLLKGSDHNNGGEGGCFHGSFDGGEDEHVCPICLDNFEVGDVVVWSSRGGSCSHVFHEECLMQWLLEQRENECPTCRACFIESDDDCGDEGDSDSGSTAATTTLDEELEGDDLSSSADSSESEISTDGVVGEIGGDGVDGTAATTDIEEGGSHHCCNSSSTKHERDDADRVKEKDEEIAAAEEENFTYVIDQGLVQKVSLS